MSARRIVVWLSCLAVTASWLAADRVAAAPSTADEARVAEAALAITTGEPSRAIDELERLADRGVLHPDVSFDRGLAYLRRAESPLQKAGDLGQAAAAFAESLVLAEGDTEAAWGLEEARLRVARRNAHAQGQAVIDTEPLGERVLGLLSQTWLFALASLGSLLASVGLLLARHRRNSLRLAARVSALVGCLFLVPAVLLAWAHHDLVLNGSTAIVIAERASLLDSAGRSMGKNQALPEAQSVLVREYQGRLARIATSQADAWVLSSTLRAVPKSQ